MGVWAIARNTLREAVRTRSFTVIVVAGVIILVLWVMIPFFTQGQDVGFLKEMELGTVTILGVVMGILVSGTVVASEMSDRTAMTLLTKPITRSRFVLGKFFGVLLTVFTAMVLLGAVLVVAVWLKAYMELEPQGGKDRAEAMARLAAARWDHVVTVLPGLALAAMQVLLVSAVAVALSMRLPFTLNALVVSGLYVLGHLLPTLRDIAVNAGVGWYVLAGLTWLFPSLTMFNVGNRIAMGHEVPWDLCVLRPLLYTVLYGTAMLLVALALFRERELS